MLVADFEKLDEVSGGAWGSRGDTSSEIFRLSRMSRDPVICCVGLVWGAETNTEADTFGSRDNGLDCTFAAIGESASRCGPWGGADWEAESGTMVDNLGSGGNDFNCGAFAAIGEDTSRRWDGAFWGAESGTTVDNLGSGGNDFDCRAFATTGERTSSQGSSTDICRAGA